MSKELLLQYCVNQRFVYLGGSLRSGKTALAFYLAHELMKKFNFRYLLSNVYSVWTDDPEDVVLRGGRKLDAIIILDEAGQFVSTPADAKKWAFALGKLNVVLILPSNELVASSMRALDIRRTLDGFAFGLPFWRYHVALSHGSINEQFYFNWLFPQQIFGIYDTDGVPVNANTLLDKVKEWTSNVAINSGYEDTAKQVAPRTLEIKPSASSGDVAYRTQQREYDEFLENLGGVSQEFAENAAKASRTLSLLEKKSRARR